MSAPGLALLSSAAAPVLLIGGWTEAARRQPDGYDSAVDTISSLAGAAANDRWLMTAALIGVGVCHLVTALGLTGSARPGRVVLGLGGVATVLVAAFPLPATGGSTAHTAAAAAAFVALAVWPAFGLRRGGDVPAVHRPAVSLAATAVLVATVIWFAASLRTGDLVGLTERIAAAAQACWPFVAAVAGYRYTTRSGRP
jgi:hypothetical membrane protein